MTETQHDLVTVAKIGSVYGVRGELRLNVFTENAQSLFNFKVWHINFGKGWQIAGLFSLRRIGENIVIKFTNCSDRDLARRYTNALLAVSRHELPDLSDDAHYWSDLEGLKVVTTDNIELGVVDHLFATGANDVLVVKGESEHLLPYIEQVIVKVDLKNKQILVAWDPNF